nr:cytochrome B [Falsirhodobacter sp. alg1]
MSVLSPAGPAAAEVARLWWVMATGAGLITAFVLAMLWGAIRGAPRKASFRVWIVGWGLVFTMTVLGVLLASALWTGERIIARGDSVVRVQAHASRYKWDFVQPAPGGWPVTTRNVLYVPAGQPFEVEIRSSDVIHSFWVPRLGGKMDAIPGHVNLHRLQADRPGEYAGQSAEFSGPGYRKMRFTLIAYDPANPPSALIDAPAEKALP